MPPTKFWDQDFAAIRRSGMRIVRTFSFWNWMEPQVARVELEPTWKFSAAQDLLEKSSLAVPQGHLLAEIPAHAVKVIHLN